ncbi:MAG: hypothetical protein ACK4S0_01805 [Sediminibacterium sp.]
MYNPQVHYRTLFSIKKSSVSDFNHVFQAVVIHTRKWLKFHSRTKHLSDEISKSWLFHGSQNALRDGDLWISVRTDGYDNETKAADYWVMRFEHTDSKYKMRKWRTDISLHCLDTENAEFSITVTWFLAKNYFGETPLLPPSSVPRLVTDILDDRSLYCNIGQKRMNQIANYLQPGDGRDMYRFVVDSSRVVPVILINIRSQKDLINPDGLQKLILGSGIVYWYDSADVHSELNYDWGSEADRYQCPPDTIRVYVPNVRVDDEYDNLRHRYFRLSQYLDTSARLIDILSQSVFRISSRNVDEDVVTNFESLYIHQQKKRLIKLREAAEKKPRSAEEQDYIDALEKENIEMSAKARQLQDSLNKEEENSLYLQMEGVELKERLNKIQHQFESIGKLEGQYKQTLVSQTNILECVSTLPKTLGEVLRVIEKLFKNTIVVLEEAHESASIAKFQHPHEAYALLFAMGTKLHSLYFTETSGDIEGDFKNHGFDVTLKEGSATNSDNKLMAHRKRIYDGTERIFSPHTKIDRGGKSLRIHYIPDHERKLIVVGHCGDHLPTAGTSRRKEG